jgi:hypothetical protein
MTGCAVAANAVLERLRTEVPALYEVWHSDPLKEDDPTPPREVQRFGHIVVEAYQSDVRDEVPVLFGLVEGILQGDDPDVRHVVAQDLLETIQTVATHHDFDPEAFHPHLGPNSQRAWSPLDSIGGQAMFWIVLAILLTVSATLNAYQVVAADDPSTQWMRGGFSLVFLLLAALSVRRGLAERSSSLDCPSGG